MPYKLNMDIPDNLPDLINSGKHIINSLTEHDSYSSGWGELTDGCRIVHSDGRYLIKYCLLEKELDRSTVDSILESRVEKLLSKGYPGGVSDELKTSMREQVYSECLRYAQIKTEYSYLLIDVPAGFIYSSASTSKKAETALGLLRKTLGSLKAQPLGVMAPSSCLKYTIINQAKDRSFREFPEGLKIDSFGLIKAKGKDSKVVTEGLNHLDENISDILKEMVIQSLDMSFDEKTKDGSMEYHSSFLLNIHNEKEGYISLKRFNYLTSMESEPSDNSSHEYLVEMILVSHCAGKILSGLESFFNEIDYQ